MKQLEWLHFSCRVAVEDGHSEHKLSVVGKWALLSATFQHFLNPLESTTMYHDSSESRFLVRRVVTLNERSPIEPYSRTIQSLHTSTSKVPDPLPPGRGRGCYPSLSLSRCDRCSSYQGSDDVQLTFHFKFVVLVIRTDLVA